MYLCVAQSCYLRSVGPSILLFKDTATTGIYTLSLHDALPILTRLQQAVEQALIGLSKDIKRAGFIADDPHKMKNNALEIVNAQNCMIIRYDSEIRHDWVYDPWNLNNSDIFTYRFKNNNVEYKTGAVNCKETKWEKLFDPAEIKVTKFDIKQKNNTIELSIGAELKKQKHVKYQVTKIIKNENLSNTESK